MKKIVVDGKWLENIHSLDEIVALCDASGEFLGEFVPSKMGLPTQPIPEFDLSVEEIRSRILSRDTTTLSEIWQRLGRTCNTA